MFVKMLHFGRRSQKPSRYSCRSQLILLHFLCLSIKFMIFYPDDYQENIIIIVIYKDVSKYIFNYNQL